MTGSLFFDIRREVWFQCTFINVARVLLFSAIHCWLPLFSAFAYTAPCFSCPHFTFVCILYPCFYSFWHCHPYILQHLIKMFLLLFHYFHCILLASAGLREPHPLCCSWSHETTCAWTWRSTTQNYNILAQERFREDSVGQRHCALE